MALSAKQKAFINEYLIDGNATRAAERAGYKGDDNVLAVTGHDLLRNPKIADIISKRTAAAAMPAEEVLNRLGEHARGNMTDFIKFDDNGNPQFDLQAAAMLGKLQLAKKLKIKTRSWLEPVLGGEDDEKTTVTETTTEFELYDAQAALVHIGKHHKLFTDKIDVEHSGAVDISADERAQAAKELEEWQQQNDSSDNKSSNPRTPPSNRGAISSG
jgi:phage terminase small subunit